MEYLEKEKFQLEISTARTGENSRSIFIPDENKAFLKLLLLHSFPEYNSRGRAFAVSTLRQSIKSIENTLLDFEHIMEDNEESPIKENIIIGHNLYAEMDEKTEISDFPITPIPVYVYSVIYKRITLAYNLMQDIMNNQRWSVSLEASRDIRSDEIYYNGKIYNRMKAPENLQEAIHPTYTDSIDGKKVVLLVGGRNNPNVSFSGVAIVSNPAYKNSKILSIIASDNTDDIINKGGIQDMVEELKEIKNKLDTEISNDNQENTQSEKEKKLEVDLKAEMMSADISTDIEKNVEVNADTKKEDEQKNEKEEKEAVPETENNSEAVQNENSNEEEKADKNDDSENNEISSESMTVDISAEAKQSDMKGIVPKSRADINDLPDAAFAVIEPAYKRGDTKDKNARHLPHHTNAVKNASENTTLDISRLRNAMARVNQIKPITDSISADALKKKAISHLVKHAKFVFGKDSSFVKENSSDEIPKEEVFELLFNYIDIIEGEEKNTELNSDKIIMTKEEYENKLNEVKEETKKEFEIKIEQEKASKETLKERIERLSKVGIKITDKIRKEISSLPTTEEGEKFFNNVFQMLQEVQAEKNKEDDFIPDFKSGKSEMKGLH